MDYAYFKANIDPDKYIDNSVLFMLIQDLSIPESRVFVDSGDSKEEWNKLLDIIGDGDRIAIRSVIDLEAEGARELLGILQIIQCSGIALCSCMEPYFSGTDYYTAFKGFIDIHKYYLKKKKDKGYKKAVEAGTVGRPKMTEAIEKAVRLYNTKAFKIEEIEKLSGVSSSTLYRALNDNDKLSNG